MTLLSSSKPSSKRVFQLVQSVNNKLYFSKFFRKLKLKKFYTTLYLSDSELKYCVNNTYVDISDNSVRPLSLFGSN
jgi:hypothetical protein